MTHESLKLSQQICFPLYAVSRLITKLYKPHLDSIGLTYPQYLVMMVLWEKDGIPVKDISERLLLESNTLTPLLKRMEGNSLLKRVRSVQDERVVIIELTEAGRHLSEKAKDIPETLFAELQGGEIEGEKLMAVKQILCEWIPQLREA